MVLILFAFAPVNDLVNLLLCGLAVVFFRKPERDRAGQAVIVGAAFLALVLAPVIFRAANMWLPAERSCCAASWQLSATCSRPTRGMRPFSGQLTRRCRYSSWTTSSHAPSVGSIPDWSQPPSSGISLARPRNAHPRASPYALAIMAVPGARASGHGGQHAPADTEGQRARRTGSGWPHACCEGLARTVRSSVRC
jgi:hypothetical protein